MSSSKKRPIYWFRWYDRYPNIRAIINLSQNLPSEKQLEIGQNLLKTVKQFLEKTMPFQPEAEILQPEVLLNLKHGQDKVRWYDQVPPLHKALNLILVLSPQQRAQLDKECGNLVGKIALHSTSYQSLSKTVIPTVFKQ